VKHLLRDFIEEGWIIAVLGAVMMIARLLIVLDKSPFFTQLKKIFVASASCSVAWFILEATDIGSLYKAISYGIIGVTAPEIIEGMVKMGKRFSRDPEHFVNRENSDSSEEKKRGDKEA
jgi:hypothetical protein